MHYKTSREQAMSSLMNDTQQSSVEIGFCSLDLLRFDRLPSNMGKLSARQRAKLPGKFVALAKLSL
jgi:hypothetical protein